ncbi:MAG: hypothetical protein D3926_17385 [Desulfobacteraceae bacterium]|nr:MAG: hypothetical protein D3926_17385 [Desulfobacteraceae bacterium]
MQHRGLKGIFIGSDSCFPVRFTKLISILLMVVCIIIPAAPGSVNGSSADLSHLFGGYTCGKIKGWAQSSPEMLYKMWANSGYLGSNSDLATDIIIRGDLHTILEHVGDYVTIIQGLDEVANGTWENVGKIFAGWLMDKVLDPATLGSGIPGAVWTVCKSLNDFAVALNAEILDLNLKTFANMTDKQYAQQHGTAYYPQLLGPNNVDYFLNDFLKIDESTGLMTNLRKKRTAFYEYVKVKLGYKNFPPMNKWRDPKNWNMVRSAARSMLNDVAAIAEKQRKFRQLQEDLKKHVERLKQEHAILSTFQSLRNQILAMSCLDAPSKDCLSVYNKVLSALADLAADAGDIKAAGSAALDSMKQRLISLNKLIEGMDKRLDEAYKKQVQQYCKSVNEKLVPLNKTISMAKSANPKIAARAVQAKGFRDKACNTKDLEEAKGEAVSAKDAADEAYLFSQSIPLLPKDLSSFLPPEPLNIAGAKSELEGINYEVTSLEQSVLENFKKWEAFRGSAASVKQLLGTFKTACSGDTMIQGVAASVLAGRFEGQLSQIEAQVPDIRFEKNMAAGFKRRYADLSTYLTNLEKRHDEYRACLKDLPDTTDLVAEAKNLIAEAEKNVTAAEKYAREAQACVEKLKSQPECGPNEEVNADGKCVCKSGFTEKDGKCVPICGPNEELNADDKCVCKSGFTEKDGRCVPICGPNEELNADDKCVCKSGFTEKDGNCVPVCEPNEELNADGKCVCKDGYTRKDGNCVKKPECEQNDDCPSGKVCENGVCVEGPECLDDGDCPKDHVCKGGKCKYQEPTGCRSDSDCAQGYVCNTKTGDCISPFDDDYDDFTDTQGNRDDQRSQQRADQSTDDQNVGGGGYTGDDLGQDLGDTHDRVSKDCDKNSDCPSGHICDNGECIRKPGCTSDSDCKGDHVCVNGKCVDKKCTSDADCPKDHVCQNGKCSKKTPSCKSDSDCPKDHVCQNGNCVPKTPAKPDRLAISPPNKVITASESAALKAILTKGSDGTTEDVTGKASWSPSSNFSSSQIGTHTVTANYQSLSATASITVVKEKGLNDITVSEKKITVTFWDHGQEDGDMIDININGKAVFPGITLTKAPQSRTITLTAGALVFGFTALNEGRISPNTATVRFSAVTQGKAEQKYTLKKNSKANMNITYKPK